MKSTGIVRKVDELGCVFCNNVDKLIDFQGQKVCSECAAKLIRQF